METLIHQQILAELKKLVIQRGHATKVQRDYAMAEECAMNEIYPLTKPSEEKRSSNLRTLKSYIGEHGVKMIMDGKGSHKALGQTMLRIELEGINNARNNNKRTVYH